jgi:hypothetical protein
LACAPLPNGRAYSRIDLNLNRFPNSYLHFLSLITFTIFRQYIMQPQTTSVITSYAPSPIPSPSTTQTSPFLLLPGELRNRIYNFCTERKPRKLRHKPRQNPNFTRPCGDYGNLQYVCRQLYSEFRPFYAARTVVEVHQPWVNAFIAICYPDAGDPLLQDKNSSTKVQGNLRIVVYFGFTFDAIPLMQLCMRHPSIRVDFSNASASLQLAGQLRELFASISSGAFRLNVEHFFEAIAIQCNRNASIVFHLRQGVEEAEDMARIEDLRSWLLIRGAPGMNGFTIVLKLHSREESSPPLEGI